MHLYWRFKRQGARSLNQDSGKLLKVFANAKRVSKEVRAGQQKTGERTTVARLRLRPRSAGRDLPGFAAAPGAGARPAWLGPEHRGRPGGGGRRWRARGGSTSAPMVLQRTIGCRGPRHLRIPGNALARSRRLQGQVNKSGWRFARSVGLVKERLMNTFLGAELWSRMYELGNQVG